MGATISKKVPYRICAKRLSQLMAAELWSELEDMCGKNCMDGVLMELEKSNSSVKSNLFNLLTMVLKDRFLLR